MAASAARASNSSVHVENLSLELPPALAPVFPLTEPKPRPRQVPRPVRRPQSPPQLSIAGALTLGFAAGPLIGLADVPFRGGAGFITLIGCLVVCTFISARVVPVGLFWAAALPPLTVVSAIAATVVFDSTQPSLIPSLGLAFGSLAVVTVAATGLALLRMRLLQPSYRVATPGAKRTAASLRRT